MVSQLAPVRRPTLSGEVADRLAEAIRSGELVPGDRLPAERELGVQFGVGRTSVREALRMLQAKGMVTVRPGDGVFVADCPTPAQQPMTRWDSQDQFRVDDLFEARLAIEPLVRRASRPGIAPSSGHYRRRCPDGGAGDARSPAGIRLCHGSRRTVWGRWSIR